VTRAPLRLLLWTTLALVPLAARAAAPLGDGKNPCFDITKVASSLSLDEPNDPNAVFYSHLSDCATLCKKAGLSCQRFAKRAAACMKGYADDRARFAAKVSCVGLKGDALKACNAPIQTQRTAERQVATDALATELTACDARASDCAGKCQNAAP